VSGVEADVTSRGLEVRAVVALSLPVPEWRRDFGADRANSVNYLYDGPNIIGEIDSAGSVLARYAHQMRVDEPLSEFRSGAGS